MVLKWLPNIDIYCPVVFSSYDIPNYALEEKLPLPDSPLGNFKWYYDDNFLLIVGNTTKEEHEEYIKKCIGACFTEDWQKGHDFYNAKNKKGYNISIGYSGYNKMTIDFDRPKWFRKKLI